MTKKSNTHIRSNHSNGIEDYTVKTKKVSLLYCILLKEHLLFIITWLTSLLLPGLCSVIMFPWKSFPAPKCDLSYLLGDIIPQQNSYSTIFPHFSAL